jgi:hypothetical protein
MRRRTLVWIAALGMGVACGGKTVGPGGGGGSSEGGGGGAAGSGGSGGGGSSGSGSGGAAGSAVLDATVATYPLGGACTGDVYVVLSNGFEYCDAGEWAYIDSISGLSGYTECSDSDSCGGDTATGDGVGDSGGADS